MLEDLESFAKRMDLEFKWAAEEMERNPGNPVNISLLLTLKGPDADGFQRELYALAARYGFNVDNNE